MRAVDIIDRKRRGEELNDAEIRHMVAGFTEGSIPDYQMSAFTMAICWRGMTAAETLTMTRAMIDSGDTVDLSVIGRPTVDKHSTGGVGDKTTLVVAPLAASLGVAVPKLSGRGLAHTGGTLDKLESIPGMRIDLSLEELVAVARETGVAVASPTADIVPADKRIYALRDATATVQSLPLITSSIMSKKLAVATDAIVLDVKMGEGAFFPTLAEAREFAESAIALGAGFGRRVRCVLTAMDRPLGRAVGNALEVAEAVATLRGEGPADLRELAIEIATQMVLAATGDSGADGLVRRRVVEQLDNGGAFTTFDHWITRQGGDALALLQGGLPRARHRIEVRADADGFVAAVHALDVGRLAMRLGAGRAQKEDTIDMGAGIVFDVTVGDRVQRGDRIAVLHTDRVPESGWSQDLLDSVVLSSEPLQPAPVVLEVVGAGAEVPA